jgi:hypothetical protein
VTDLKQSDFEIHDNGRKQEVKYFGKASQDGAADQASDGRQQDDAVVEPVFTNRPAFDITGQPHTAA